MIVTLGFYKRRPDLTWQQFSDYWKDVHGPLLRDAPTMRKYMRRYVQHHLRPNPGSPNAIPLDFDGFSEVWYESAEARQQLLADPFCAEVMIPDEVEFLDMSATRVSVLDSQVVQIGAVPRLFGDGIQFI